MIRERLGLILAVVLAAAAGIWFYASFEKVKVREFTGPQGEARTNPYLAASRLLGRMGLESRAIRSLPELGALPAGGTLVLPDRREALTTATRARLFAWVEAGGHLITEDEGLPEPDPVLERFGVTRKPGPKKSEVKSIEIELPGAERPVRVQMHSQQLLEAPGALLRVDGEGGAHLLHLRAGRGRVTVLNDLAFMRNPAIGEFDHAEFLWQLTRLAPDSRAVLFFNDPSRPSLWAWLRANAWAALIAGAALIVLWLWHVVPRFGPLMPDPEPARRRLLDHLRASGRFEWAAGAGARLVEAAREAALRRIARAQPDFALLTPPERRERLQQVIGLAPEEADRVLKPLQRITPPEFVRTIRALQAVHERLALRTGGTRTAEQEP